MKAHQFRVSKFRTSFGGVKVEHISYRDIRWLTIGKAGLVLNSYVFGERFFSLFALIVAAARADLNVSVNDNPDALSRWTLSLTEVEPDCFGSTRHSWRISSMCCKVV